MTKRHEAAPAVYLVWDAANQLVHGCHASQEAAEAQVAGHAARGTGGADGWVVLEGRPVS